MMERQKVWRERPLRPLLLILLLAFALRLVGLDHQSLWWDELKTIERATLSWPALLSDLINTKNQLPLYYLFMRGGVWLGTSAFVVRAFSLFWGLLGVAAIYQLGKRIASQRVGQTVAFLLAISPFHIWYAQEARMYSFLTTLLILAHLALAALLQARGRWYGVLYATVMTTAVFTHYFTFLILLAHAIFFILHLRPLKPLSWYWFGFTAVLAILFSPWIYLIVGRSGYGEAVPTWINPTRWAEPFWTLWNFASGPTLSPLTLPGYAGLAIFSFGFLAYIFHVRLQSNVPLLIKRLLILWLFVPLLLIYLVSMAGAFSLYVDRYLIIILPSFLLSVAWGWAAMSRNRPGWLWGLCFIATAVSTTALFNLHTDPSHARSDWQTTFTTIADHWQTQDQIIGTRDVQLPLAYYGRSTMPYLQLPPAEADALTPAFAQVMTAQLAEATAVAASRFWFIEPFYVTDPHGWAAERNSLVNGPLTNPHHQWLSDKFSLVETWRFPGVRLTLYTNNDQP